jgi:uncharacterized protein (TIGR02265 family)
MPDLQVPMSAIDLPEGFTLPDWKAPFDPTVCLDGVPDTATGKGMFLNGIRDEFEARGLDFPATETFYNFQDYPLRDCMELAYECAKQLEPAKGPREGLRTIAKLNYGTFTDSMIGRVLFGKIGVEVSTLFKLASRAMRHTQNVGKLETIATDANSVTIRASDFHFFMECIAPGLAEGALEACRKQGLVAQKIISPTEGEFLIRWSG